MTDPTGAVVPNAKVIATKSDTNSQFETVTNAEGLYTIPFLPPGPYSLSAEATGFKKFVQSGMQIGSDMRVAQDVTLTLGSASESVTVTADAAQLESVTASAGQVITTHEVESLPVNGRAPMDLAILGYGVVNTGVRDQNRPFENSGFSTFAMGGAATGANAALLDGVPNVGTLGEASTRISFSPPVDSVVDVKVEAFNVDASYGGFGGGTVEITTKGGTNEAARDALGIQPGFEPCGHAVFHQRGKTAEAAVSPEPVGRNRGRSGVGPESFQRQESRLFLLRL